MPADIIRLAKDLEEVKQMNNVKLLVPKKSDITVFDVKLKVQDGLYSKKWFTFHFIIPNDWPNTQPDVRIKDKIWHPNIELTQGDQYGRVCVSTLKSNYLGTMLMMSIVESLKFLLVNPNPDDALNTVAADEYKKNYDLFKEKAKNYIDEMGSDDED